MPKRRFLRRDFDHPAATLAPRLLGARLCRRLDDGGLIVGRIVEVEAYTGPRDQASHARNGHRSPRNQAMYARGGTAYVYFTYGMHHCFNVVCAQAGDPQAVLIRAVEPLEGLEHMQALRVRPGRRARIDPRHLARGPACLCQALAIDRALNETDMVTSDRLWLEHAPLRAGEKAAIRRTPRVGVDSAGAWALRPLRWLIAGHPSVSGPKGEGGPRANTPAGRSGGRSGVNRDRPTPSASRAGSTDTLHARTRPGPAGGRGTRNKP
jgi:DNA-3-methyladenine glycosylase